MKEKSVRKAKNIYLSIGKRNIVSANDKTNYMISSPMHENIATVGLILGLHPANDRRRYNVTPFFIGWAQT